MKLIYFLVPGSYLATLGLGSSTYRTRRESIVGQEMYAASEGISQADRHVKETKEHHNNMVKAALSQTPAGYAVSYHQALAVDRGKSAYAHHMLSAANRLDRARQIETGMPVSPISNANQAMKASVRADKSSKQAKHAFMDLHMATSNARNKGQHLANVAAHTAAAASSPRRAAAHFEVAREGLRRASAIDRGPSLARNTKRP